MLLEAINLLSVRQCSIPFKFIILFEEMSSSLKNCSFETGSMLEIELHLRLRVSSKGKLWIPATDPRHYFYECITFTVLISDLSMIEFAIGSSDL